MPTSAARHPWWRRPCRCSRSWAWKRSESITTSSPPPGIPASSEEQRTCLQAHWQSRWWQSAPEPLTMKERPHDIRSRTQCSQAGLHRRGGRGEGIPGLERPPVQLLHARQAQADPLRGRDSRGPAGPAALPRPGVALRFLRRPGRGPAGLDGPEPGRYPGSCGKGYDWPALGWHEFRDPNEEWELTFYRYNSNVVRQLNQNIDAARQAKAFEQWNRSWVTFVERNVGAWMHVDHGLGLYLFANANRRAPTNMHNNAISVNSMHRIRSAQDLALYNLSLTEEIEGFDGTAHRETWNSDPAWQGVRDVAEQMTAIVDWCEAIFVANVIFEPRGGEVFRSQLVQHAAPRNGDFVTPTVVGAEEYDYAERDLRYTRPMFELLTSDREFGDQNKAKLQEWLSVWVPKAIAASRTLQPLWSQPESKPPRFEDGLDAQKARFSGILADLHLENPKELAQ